MLRHIAISKLVGTGRFELPTCRLGGDRSIQLSYVPTQKSSSILNPFSGGDKSAGSALNPRFSALPIGERQTQRQENGASVCEYWSSVGTDRFWQEAPIASCL